MSPTSPNTDPASLFRLDGRTALVTGGAGVLGEAICRGLGRAGARIVVASRRIQAVEGAAKALSADGVEARGIPMDARDHASVAACAHELAESGWLPDVLVNAAGGNDPKATTDPAKERTAFDLDVEALREVVDLNLFGGAAIPSLVFGREMAKTGRPGSIIMVSSASAIRPLTRVAGYSAAKAAVSSFAQWLAVHFARDAKVPIRVNALVPGFFLTEQNRFLLTTPEGGLTDRGGRIVDHTPMGRFGRAEELVGPCILLAGEASSFMTGTAIVVDGGFNAWSGV